MVTGERLRITVTGGAPWGFRLQGGGHFPLEVAKIRKKSHAFNADLREGDVVLSINGHQMSGRTHQSAMDIVEMSSSDLVFDIVRPSKDGMMKVQDPQRQLRSVPAHGQAPSGLVSSSHTNFTTNEGNMRREVQTDQYVTTSGGGRKITKTVKEERTMSYPKKSGLSPSPSHNIIPPGGHQSRSPNRSPLMWKPSSLSPSQSQANALNIETQRTSQSWQQSGMLSPRAPSDVKSSSPLVWQPKSTSPSPSSRTGSHGRSVSFSAKTSFGKENEDPWKASEQAKWEARKGPENVPKFKLENFGSVRADPPASKSKYATLPKVNDPNYPMFDMPKADWSPQRAPPSAPQPALQQSFPTPFGKKPDPPPVPPKPVSPAPPMVNFDPYEEPEAGSDRHRPGMIRPPLQPQVVTAPAPPPPPMPMPPMAPAPLPPMRPDLFQPNYASSPMENGYDELDVHRGGHGGQRPDHLPVFAPKVYFTPEDDSGLYSPDRTGFHDAHSDISSLAKKKLFSDSAFYDDHTNRYPTIDEQMSMCKKIADSLTSAANNRAKGARMFMKRQRKANKWIHDHKTGGLILVQGTSEYSSSAGDVADLDDLDSELYWDEGGNKPLFTFRIPKLAGQISQGQRMSLTKEEFERLRFVAPRVDHSAVSPNVCFNIAADLQKGGRNKGAKLFQKRQARVEKFVIDESNVQHSPMSPTKLEQIVHNLPARHQPSPWEVAAAKENVNAAYDQRGGPQRNFQPPIKPTSRHTLVADSQPKLMGGKNYNTVARGWQGSGPGHQQPSYYREGIDDASGLEHQQQEDNTTGEGGYEQQQQPLASFQNQQQQMWQQEHGEDTQDGSNKFGGDYNRRVKAWKGSGAPQPTRTVQSYSEQTNYNSLPRGFGMQPKHELGVAAGYCDL